MRNIKEIENDLYLADNVENKRNAEEIAKKLMGKGNDTFTIFYIPTQKENVLLYIQKLGCVIVKKSNNSNCVTALMTNEQLIAIKKLDCIERIEIK